MNTDYANQMIRQQPLEFVVMTVERLPGICQKDVDLLKDILELIFKLMIDIDEDIEQSWLRPEEGFQEDAENDGETATDNLNFGKSCIDNIVAAVGEQKCLPILG